MRSPFLLRYRLSPNQLRPLVQLRPAPLCRGRLMHIHNKILFLYAEANGLCNRSPWLCLLLSCSKHAQWSPKWTSKMVAQKCVAMDPPPFGAQPHVTSPTHSTTNMNICITRLHSYLCILVRILHSLPLTTLE